MQAGPSIPACARGEGVGERCVQWRSPFPSACTEKKVHMITSAKLSAFLREKADGASAAELRELRSKLSVADAERQASEIEAARRKALVNGSDEEVDALERRLNAAKREVERLAAAVEELDARIAAAEQAELAAELDAITAAAKKRRSEMGEDFAALGKALDEAARAMARIAGGHAFVKQSNERLVSHRRAAVKEPYMLFFDKHGNPPTETLFLGTWTLVLKGSPEGFRFIETFRQLAEVCRDA